MPLMALSRRNALFLLVGGLFLATPFAVAHFQVLIPSTDIVEAGDPMTVNLDILFTHPMEQGPVMPMGKPKQFGVMVGGKKKDLMDSLQARPVQGKTAYTASYRIEGPGDCVFYLEPAPYWEPAERKMIVHYTKVVVEALGAEEGWDRMLGLPVEIMPLTRPYGLWAGNCFRGVVIKDGKPVPFATVEVEYYNQGKQVTPPAGPFVTQVVKADANGTFCYTMPRAGWWAFAALIDGDRPMANPQGEQVDVELGALMWVRAVEME
jgi:cobalt/nickel transport protein